MGHGIKRLVHNVALTIMLHFKSGIASVLKYKADLNIKCYYVSLSDSCKLLVT